MAETVRKVNYCYVTVPQRAGQGVKVFRELTRAGVNLLGHVGFPAGRGRAQLDFVAERLTPIQRLAKQNGWRLSRAKKAFLVQGPDEVGACHRVLERLAEARINVTAAAGVSAGNGGYGMLVWVKPKDFNRAARILGAR